MIRVQCDHRPCCGVDGQVFKHLWLCNGCRDRYRIENCAGGWALVPVQRKSVPGFSSGQQN
jgi:hypothetical protein